MHKCFEHRNDGHKEIGHKIQYKVFERRLYAGHKGGETSPNHAVFQKKTLKQGQSVRQSSRYQMISTFLRNFLINPYKR